MNSRQRRQIKRKYKFVINQQNQTMPHFLYAKVWCEEFLEDGTWQADILSRKFKFSKQKDAVLFALKWL